MGVAEHRTFCRICPVLCGLVVRTDGDRVVEVRGDREHPVTKGYTCPKGRAAGDFHHHPRRLDGPRLHGRAVGWDELLDDLAAALGRIVAESGPDAVAVYWGTWSWMDAFGRLRADALLRHLGTRSRYSAITVDAIARLTVAELLTGSPSPFPALDADDPGLTVLVGTNPVVSHGHSAAVVDPVTTLRRVARDHGLWVLDPRRTESARLATRHLAVRPGTDHLLLACVVRALLDDGADEAYLRRHAAAADIDALRRAVEPWRVEPTSERTGVAEADIEGLVAAIRAAGRVTVLTGTGTTMAPTAVSTEWLAWAVQIVTGSFEAPGGAWFNPGAIARAHAHGQRAATTAPAADTSGSAVAARLEPGPPSRPDLPARFGERPCAALADEIEAGNVRALLVVGGDPLTSLPDTTRLDAAFARLDVLAVADVIEADTVARATHVLSVAGMLERDDVTWFTDRFPPVMAAQRTNGVLAPGADRRLLADVVDDLGARLGLAPEPDRWARLVRRLPELSAPGVVVHDPPRVKGWVHERLLPAGRWNLAPRVLVERFAADAADPVPLPGTLVAVPRRALRRMNSMLRDVGRGGDDGEVWLHPDDAATASVADGQRVLVTAARAGAGPGAAIEATARVTTGVVPGCVSVSHGLHEANVNRLTSGTPGSVDPFTGMVVQSGIAVRVTPAGDRPPPG